MKEVFVPLLGTLNYDLMEIEHPFYMYDHRCVGCVTLKCTQKIDTTRLGKAFVDDIELPECFCFDIFGSTPLQMTLIGVKLRGFVDYDRSYTLRLSDFYTEDGYKIEPVELPLRTMAKTEMVPGYEVHDQVALQAAREGIVLLKNEDSVLPMQKNSILNLFGSGVCDFRISAIGAGRINPRYTVGLVEAAESFGGFQVNDELAHFYRISNNSIPGREIMLRARECSDAAVIILTRGTGENVDNQPIPGEYYLTEDEDRLIGEVSSLFENTIVVLNTGYPIHMDWAKRYPVKGIIYCGIAGQSATRALCEIMAGKVDPSGRLTDTWAWDYFDIPSSANFYCPREGERPVLADDGIWADTRYEEGIYVGYRYFDTFKKDVAFGFGHGLSYTSFEKKVISDVQWDDGKYTVEIQVENTGTIPGKETLILYAEFPGNLQEQPRRQLVAFEKSRELCPGESQTLTLYIPQKLLATWIEEENAWVVEKGIYQLYLGGAVSESQKIDSIEITGQRTVQKLKYRMQCPVEMEEMSVSKGILWPRGRHTGLFPEHTALSHKKSLDMKRNGKLLKTASDTLILWRQVLDDPKLLESFVAQMTDEELCRLNLMYNDDWGMERKGAAGSLAPLEKYGLPEYVVCDGNCGLNLQKPNIGMPTSVVVCATWNKALAEAVGYTIGEEAVDNGIGMVLATAMNIHRNPLNGRQPEYFSEDPFLTGQMAGYQVKGMHKAGVSDSIKHVICNNCETSRKYNHSLVGERALREIYLRAFELLMDVEKPDSMMTSYNACNGTMTAENTVLLEGIFREELGFDGFAMTDWNSYDTADMVTAVNAGISWLTPGEKDGEKKQQLLDALKDGRIKREVIQENIYRMLKVICRRNRKN